MFPILLKIGPFTLHTYGALVAVGFFAGYLLTVRRAKAEGIPEGLVTDFAWVALLSGLAGARLLYVAFNWMMYEDDPLAILKIWEGGLVWYGGLIAAAGAGALFLRRQRAPVRRVADAAAPGVALGQAIGRLGCFMAGCCYGRPSEVPWAVVFRSPDALAPAGIALHPSQLYEAGLLFVLCAALVGAARRVRDALGPGGLALLYLEGYSVIRLGVEFTRGDDRGPVFLTLTATQWLAILLLIAASAGTALLLVRKKRPA